MNREQMIAWLILEGWLPWSWRGDSGVYKNEPPIFIGAGLTNKANDSHGNTYVAESALGMGEADGDWPNLLDEEVKVAYERATRLL